MGFRFFPDGTFALTIFGDFSCKPWETNDTLDGRIGAGQEEMLQRGGPAASGFRILQFLERGKADE